MRRHIVRATLLLALAAGLIGSASCTMRQGTGNSYLIIERIEAQPGGSDDEPETTLQSDVRSSDGGVFEDVGIVTLSLGLKDAQFTGPTPPNFITVTRYRVVYRRADGRNTPGVDVPHPFDGAFTVTVGSESVGASFVLVRIQAKREAPLPSLVGCGGACAVTTFAEVTFYGQDQSGRSVEAKGQIQVDFADWAG